MAQNRRRPYFWAQHIDDNGAWRRSTPGATPMRPTGQELAALRRGIGREAGTVPELWPYYQTVNNDALGKKGLVSNRLKAEHIALSLYGLHQQSQDKPMHAPGRSLGAAVRRLRNSDAFSADAVNRRFNAAATANTQHELTLHLRSLITLLRGQKIALDYTQLLEDLARWPFEEGRSRSRRRWGNDYFGWSSPANNDAPTADVPNPSPAAH